VREGARHPVHWVKGEGIPPEHITPWELLLFFFNRAFSGMFDGFSGRQDFLYKEWFRIPVNKISVAGVISSVWDAVNDPILGGWMDKKRFGPRGLRNIMRVSAVVGSVFAVVKMADGGMSQFQHLVLLVICNMAADITGTMNGVASQKMRAGISPLSQQRGRIDVWGNMGASLTWIIGNLPTVLMGFSDYFKLNDYQIIFYGSLILLPFGVFAHILPTFIRQRVDYSYPEGEGTEKQSLRETFEVVKHNRYFVVNTIASFVTVFSPDVGDELMIYRYIMPTFKAFGREVGGEALLPVKQMLSGTLSNILQPFHRQIINRVGGPLRAQQLKCLVNIFNRTVMFLCGYKSVWRFAVLVAMESLWNAMMGFDGVAGSMLGYEWYDYVELQTGLRSEGVTTAVNNLFGKIVTDNIGRVTGNAFLAWTGYTGGYKEDGVRPPEKYLKYMWPMYTLIPVLDHSIWFAARCFVKWTPQDRENTERALAERRAAAGKLAQAAAEEVGV
jgi:Na+/melibiose symporter-like transporter